MTETKQGIDSLASEVAHLTSLLQQRDGLLASLYNSTSVMMLRVAPDGRVVGVNDATEAWSGRKKEVFLGRFCGEVLNCVEAHTDLGCWRGDTCETCVVRDAVQRTFETNSGVLHKKWEQRIQVASEETVWTFLVSTVLQAGSDGDEVLLSLQDLSGRDTNAQLRAQLAERKRLAAVFEARGHLFEYAGSHSLADLLEETLNVVERLTGSKIAFFHFVEPDQKSLTLQNWSTETKRTFCRAEGEGSHYDLAAAGVWVDCFHQRKPVIHNDYASLSHKKGMPAGHAEVVRELVVPVLRGDQVVAILGVGNKSGDYDQRDAEAVSRLADLVWDITERKRSTDQIEHLNRVLRSIRIVNQVIVREKDPERLLQQVCDTLVETRDYGAAWIVTQDVSGRPIRWAEASWGEAFIPLARSLEKGVWPTCRSLAREAKDRLVVIDTNKTCGACPLRVQCQSDAAVIVGLRQGDRTLGLLCVSFPQTRILADEEQSLLVELADDIALALWNIEAELERARVEKALVESEVRYRTILHTAIDGFWLVDLEGRLLQVNEAYCRMSGYRSEELLSLRITDLDTVETPDQTAAHIQAIMERGSARFESSHRRKDGAIFHVEISALYQPFEGGRFVVFIHDISERKLAETAIRSEKLFTDTALDAQPDTFFLFEPTTGKALRWNRAFRNTSGYTDEEIARLPAPTTYYGPEDLERAAAFTEVVLADGSGTIELDFICKDGRRVPTEYRVSVVGDDHPEPRYIISIGRDVTERREIEAQLAQSDRLSSMGLLAAGVAHEINNPLSYVLYNIESLVDDVPELLAAVRQFRILLDDRLGPEAVDEIAGDVAQLLNPPGLMDILERFDESLEGAHRIREIVRGLSTFSRVEKDRLVPVDLRHIIDVAANMAANEIKYRARLVLDYGQIPLVMAGEGRLSQVFLNLLINAAHAIDEGDVERNEIRVRTWAEGYIVCAEVYDTGAGIAPGHLDRLFDPFFTTKEIGAGSGLGLAISKSIVEGYGGTIAVESELGKFTRFVLRLPVRQQKATLEVDAVVGSVTEPQVLGRILVIDDDDRLRSVMRRMLKAHEVVDVDSGEAAMALLRRDPVFDIILCDMMMPNVSGMDLHEWLLSENPRLAKQLIFITGGAFTPRARRYLQSVDNLRIDKPFDRRNVVSIIRDRIAAVKGIGS